MTNFKYTPRGLPRVQSHGGLSRGSSAALPLDRARGLIPRAKSNQFNIGKFLILISTMILLFGCADENNLRQDVAAIPQDAKFFANLTNYDIKITPADALKNQQKFLQYYFYPWNDLLLLYKKAIPMRIIATEKVKLFFTPLSLTMSDRLDVAEWAEKHAPEMNFTNTFNLNLSHHFIAWFEPFMLQKYVDNIRKVEVELIENFIKKPGWNVNKNPHTAAWVQSIADNMNLDAFPSLALPAIVVRDTDLRLLPTNLPAFFDWDKPGKGYPFDMLQSSLLGMNKPIYVLHASRDGRWQFVVTNSNSFGWVKTLDIAYVSQSFMQRWQTHKYVVAVRDQQVLVDHEQRFYAATRLGQLFPLKATTAQFYQVFAVTRDVNGKAQLKTLELDRQAAAIWPLELNKANLANAINSFMGTAYGWGGMYGLRDCSATMRDLFTLFAIWLPRNSSDQADIGKIISLEGMSNRAKEQRIIQQGIPFVTLLNRHGHVVLYLGEYQGKPYVFHNMWGIVTKNYLTWWREDRVVIGKSVITDLVLGKKYFNTTTSLLDSLISMTILVPFVFQVTASL